MPRYVSAYRGYTFTALGSQKLPVMRGGHLVETVSDPGVECIFQHHALLDWEWEEAMTRLSLRGIGYDEDPRHRFSVYDTDQEAYLHGWDKERKEAVEARLDESLGPDLIRVEKPRLEAPWPTYDKLVAQGKRTKEMVAQRIADYVVNDGFEPNSILTYERENLNRPEVIEAVEAAAATVELVEEGEEITA